MPGEWHAQAMTNVILAELTDSFATPKVPVKVPVNG